MSTTRLIDASEAKKIMQLKKQTEEYKIVIEHTAGDIADLAMEIKTSLNNPRSVITEVGAYLRTYSDRDAVRQFFQNKGYNAVFSDCDKKQITISWAE